MKSSSNFACELCISPCLTGDSKVGDKCTSCVDDNHYINSTNNFACESCISPCMTCDKNDGVKCTSCIDNKYYMNNTNNSACGDIVKSLVGKVFSQFRQPRIMPDQYYLMARIVNIPDDGE